MISCLTMQLLVLWTSGSKITHTTVQSTTLKKISGWRNKASRLLFDGSISLAIVLLLAVDRASQMPFRLALNVRLQRHVDFDAQNGLVVFKI